MQTNRQRRIFYGWMILAVVILLILFRLAWLQFVMKHHKLPGSNHTLLEASMLQRERGIVLDSGRGQITDRNGTPFTGKMVWTAVLLPLVKEDELSMDAVHKLAHILGADSENLEQLWRKSDKPMLWHQPGSVMPLALDRTQASAIMELKLPGVLALPYEQRYEDAESGKQWLGYISGQRKENLFYRNYEGVQGSSGLERTMDALLQGTGPTVLYFPMDGKNQLIQDLQPMAKGPDNPYYPLTIMTTIEAELQEQIEQLTKQAGMKKGAVVVLDVRNGDVIAMVSRPFYNPENVHPEQGQWENRALMAAAPGSIFKIVTAAAALEHGLTNERESFHCSGEYGKYGLSCWKKDGHGTLTLRQGFAQSCNIVFAELAERLKASDLTNTAKSLGVGETVGWEAVNLLGMPVFKPFDHEQAGTVFTYGSESDPGAKVQTAIGQRDTSMTPLQAANLIVTLLQDGEIVRPRLVKKISYANGQLLRSFPPAYKRGEEGRISRRTARQLLDWMEDVVDDGTGRSLQGTVWKLAGKSGTAETLAGGVSRNNQWFAGYGPADHPKYAAAVLFEEMQPGARHQAVRLFGQVMDVLAEHEEGV